MAKMNIWKFSIYTFVAMFPLTTLYVYFGMKLGPHWEKAADVVGQYMLPILLVVVIVVGGILIYKFMKKETERNLSSHWCLYIFENR